MISTFWAVCYTLLYFAIAGSSVAAAIKKPREKNFLSPSMAALSFIFNTVMAVTMVIDDWNHKTTDPALAFQLETTFFLKPLIAWLQCYLFLEMSTTNMACHKILTGITIVYIILMVALNTWMIVFSKENELGALIIQLIFEVGTLIIFFLIQLISLIVLYCKKNARKLTTASDHCLSKGMLRFLLVAQTIVPILTILRPFLFNAAFGSSFGEFVCYLVYFVQAALEGIILCLTIRIAATRMILPDPFQNHADYG